MASTLIQVFVYIFQMEDTDIQSRVSLFLDSRQQHSGMTYFLF